MELKGKKVLVFGGGKSGIGAADLLNAVGACPVLYDGKADLDKESVLHKISGNYELPIYAGAAEGSSGKPGPCGIKSWSSHRSSNCKRFL